MTIRRKLTRRERILTFLTTFALVGGGAYVYAIEPLAAAWLDIRAEANAAAQELSKLDSLIANRNAIESEFEEYAGAMTLGASEETLQVDLLKEIEHLATSSGLRVSSIRPLRLRTVGRLDRLGVELNAACAGHEFVKFLQAIQDPSHLLRAEDINLEVHRERPPLTVTLTLTKLVKIDRRLAQAAGG